MNFDPNAVLRSWIPNRMQALDTMRIALRHFNADRETAPLKIYIDGKLVIEGTGGAFIFPAIESGIVNGRALLEFMGLRVDSNRRLASISPSKRRKDDICIERFATNGVHLQAVSVNHALRCYGGPQEEAERSLIAILDLANKGLAHMTADVEAARWSARELEIACEGIPALIVGSVYTPLGLPEPRWRNTSRPREDDTSV